MQNLLEQDWSSQTNWEQLLENLSLRDPKHFVSGQLHTELNNWESLFKVVDNEHSNIVREWLHNGVDVEKNFKPYKGTFKGNYIDTDKPPVKQFQNYDNCIKFKDEIIKHLEEGLRSGALECVGRVGEVQPPHLVMPLLMIEGAKKPTMQ